jgi:hypothetical protein
MAQLDDAQLLALFEQYLPNNDNELITPSVLRLVLAQLVDSKVSASTLLAFAQLSSPRFTGTPQVPTAPAGTDSDQVASTAFVQATLAAIASGKNFSELVLPKDVQSGYWYLTGNGIWEARRSFSAVAEPVNGPNWRLLAGFAGQLTTLPVASLSDATDAGRAMLTAPSAAAQRALVNNPQIRAGQYGNHPSFNSEDGPTGAWAWVLKAILALSSGQAMQPPAAPTAGLVDDTADTFSFLPNPAYPSFAQYKVAGLPGITGAVALDSLNSYVQGSRIYIKVVGAVAKNGLAVYVAGSGNVPDGQVLTNADPFTGSAVVTPPVTTALAVAFTIGSNALPVGQALSYSASASGGTSPYTHVVHAENVDTGVVTDIGTAAAGMWQNVPAGTYDLTDTVTDAAGTSKISAVRRLVVTAAAPYITDFTVDILR